MDLFVLKAHPFKVLGTNCCQRQDTRGNGPTVWKQDVGLKEPVSETSLTVF